jgi:pimeloyl-ACP methyl ester carboxylesterase
VLRHQTVHLEGRRLHVVLAGTGRPAVIFDAGAGIGASHWSQVQASVAQRTETFAYDRAGVGSSDPKDGQWTLDRLVDDLEGAVASVGLSGPYVVVGHSFGGHVVRSFAARQPDNVVGMVLVDARPARLDELCPAWREWARALDDNPQLANAVEDANRHVQALPGLGSLPLSVLTHGIPDMVEAEASLASDARTEFEDVWQALQRDHANLSSNGRLVIARQSGHLIADTEPDLITSAILGLIDADHP